MDYRMLKGAAKFGLAMAAIVWLRPLDVAACVPQDKVTVDVVGLSVTKPDPDSQFGWSLIPGRNAGTEVHIRLTAAGQTILSVATAKSDGAGELGIAVSGGGKLKAGSGGGDLNFLAQISEDGQHCTLPIQSDDLPPAGTRALTVTGRVKITTGNDLQTQRVKIELKPEAQFQIGTHKLELSDVEDDMFGEDAWSLTFQSSQSLATIKEFKFFDDAGQEIESSAAGSHSFGFGNQMTYGRSFRVMGKPTSVHVEASYFASTQDIEVPIDLTCELGLGK